MQEEKREKPTEDQSIVEWFNNELGILHANYGKLTPDSIINFFNDFNQLMEEAKEYEEQRALFHFQKGFSLAEKMNERD